MAFKKERFSPTDHFNIEQYDEDFAIIPLAPKVEGALKP